MMSDPVADNLKIIRSRIAKACEQSGRPAGSVKLLLATKTVSAPRIKLALDQGEYLIGENKVQEVKEKFEYLQNVPHESHFIGHLQTNKIKDIIKYDITCIQSLDRWDLAEKLNMQLLNASKNMDVLIQVNSSFEESKFGVSPAACLELVRRVSQLSNLKIKGLMTIGLFSSEAAEVRKCFRLMKAIQTEIINAQIPNVAMPELSMGMSNDLEVAIEEGATIVRVGTALFGQRVYPDSFYWNENHSATN